MNNTKRKNIFLSIIVILIGLTIAGGTYAFLSRELIVTNQDIIAGKTACFEIEYEDDTDEITGTLFPSSGPAKGLYGSVSLNTKNGCLDGKGTLYLHFEGDKDNALLTNIAEPHCENKKTLETLPKFDTETSCTESNERKWVTNGTPLKYAVYNGTNLHSNGYITASDRDRDKLIYSNFSVTDTKKLIDIYIWLDGNLTDNAYTNLPVSASVRTEVIQSTTGSYAGDTPIITGDTSVIPNQYKYLDYIESTGSQYIDTGIVPTDTTGVYAKLSSNDVTTNSAYFGSMGSGDSRFYLSNQSGKIYFGWNTYTPDASRPSVISNEISIIQLNYLNSRKNIYKDTIFNISNSLSTSNTYPIVIFANNSSGSINSKSKIKLYELKISDGSSITHEFLPCYRRSDGEVGLYDKIENRFYGNAGTGKFDYPLEPNDINPVEYIESTGTQYIDTGFKHNQNTRILADIDFQPVGSWKSPFGSWGGPNSSPKKMFGAEYDGNVTLTLFYGNGSTKSITDKSIYTGRKIWDFNKNVWSIGSYNYTFSAQNFQSQFNDFIFASCGYSGTVAESTNVKVYSFKIYDDENLVRDYIPCYRKVNGEAGLYDRIENKFYGNSGTGEFKLPTVTPELPQSDTSISRNMGYVTNGLMLHYDGRQNMISSHSSNTTTWTNLVKGNGFNGTLNNGPVWGDNYLEFDGTNDWVSVGQMNYGNVTVEVVVEYASVTNSSRHIASNYENGGYGISNWSKNGNTDVYTKNGFTAYIGGAYRSAASSTNYIADKKYSLSGSYDGNVIRFLENNVKYTTPYTGIIGNPINSTIFGLGAGTSGSSTDGAFTPMKLYSVRVYNRALTDEEVQKNYNIDKKRFGIE